MCQQQAGTKKIKRALSYSVVAGIVQLHGSKSTLGAFSMTRTYNETLLSWQVKDLRSESDRKTVSSHGEVFALPTIRQDFRVTRSYLCVLDSPWREKAWKSPSPPCRLWIVQCNHRGCIDTIIPHSPASLELLKNMPTHSTMKRHCACVTSEPPMSCMARVNGYVLYHVHVQTPFVGMEI